MKTKRKASPKRRSARPPIPIQIISQEPIRSVSIERRAGGEITYSVREATFDAATSLFIRMATFVSNVRGVEQDRLDTQRRLKLQESLTMPKPGDKPAEGPKQP